MADGRDKQDPANRIPGDLPLLNTGWSAGEWDFEPGAAFWEHAAKFGADGSLADHLDLAMAGKSAPRVWLIMHEPGQPELSAAVAVAFARELGGRDQAALVLDCDDQSQALTRWCERIEAEGWIDLARYGTSVMTAGVAMPFAGRRGYFLGVGSFAPTDVTAKEIELVVQRLRRQADDLILVAPADEIGKMWSAVAGIRLLCWDRANRPSAQIENLVASMAAAGGELTALVGFGLPKAELAAAVTSADEAQVTEERPEVPIAAAGDNEVDPVPLTDDFEPPALAADGDYGDGDGGWADAPADDGSVSVSKGTSGVFWFLASAAVVIVAILGVYWFKYVRVPTDGHFQPIEVATQGAPERVPGDRSQGDMANQDDPPPESAAHAGALIPSDADSLMNATAREIASVPGEDAISPTAAGAMDEGAGERSTETETSTQDADEQQLGAAGPFEPRTTAPETPAFSMEPYRDTVGSAGWALHLYSLPDSLGAEAELTELHRRGFKTEVRVVETADKGRWWRVYVGTFASRAEARTAAPLLKEKLRTDWANPTRF